MEPTRCTRRSKEADELHPKTKQVGEEHLSTLIVIAASLSDPSPPEVTDALITSATPGSFSSSRHYAWVKAVKSSRTLIVLSGPDQLSCNNHPFFEGLHPLLGNMKTFYDKVISVEGNTFEAFTIA